MKRQSQKEAVAYYTPDLVVARLIHWVVRHAQDRMLDPACGDGRFIAGHRYRVWCTRHREAGCAYINSVHSVRVRDCSAAARLMTAWESSFLKLSCELEGHPLGAGMLKLEPGEANQLVHPPPDVMSQLNGPIIEEAITTMRAWRLYACES